MNFRLGTKDTDSPFAVYGPTLAYAAAAVRDAHELIDHVWIQHNVYAKQIVIEMWWSRPVTLEEEAETARVARATLQPWLERDGMLEPAWHISARRGRVEKIGERLPPLLVDDAREPRVRKAFPRASESPRVVLSARKK